MLVLVAAALALTTPAAKKPAPPRPVVVLDVAAAGVVEGVDKDEFNAVSDRVAAAFGKDAGLVVSVVDRACADDACAAAVGDSDVVWGTLAKNGPLFLLDLHLHEVAKGGSIVRARLEAPDLQTLGLQIDDAAVRMMGGEPVRDFPVGVVVGGLVGGLGVIAACVGGVGVVWALATDDKTADDLFVASAVTAGVGLVAAAVGIGVVGASVDE